MSDITVCVLGNVKGTESVRYSQEPSNLNCNYWKIKADINFLCFIDMLIKPITGCNISNIYSWGGGGGGGGGLVIAFGAKRSLFTFFLFSPETIFLIPLFLFDENTYITFSETVKALLHQRFIF